MEKNVKSEIESAINALTEKRDAISYDLVKRGVFSWNSQKKAGVFEINKKINELKKFVSKNGKSESVDELRAKIEEEEKKLEKLRLKLHVAEGTNGEIPSSVQEILQEAQEVVA